MKNNKGIKVGVIIVIMSLLTGCKSKYGSVPSQSEVMAEVERTCINESYTYEGKETDSGRPKKVTYTFVTEGRGLEFHGISTLVHPRVLGNVVAYYEGAVSCDYAKAVANLYHDDIVKIFSQVDYFNSKERTFDVDINCNVDEIVDIICQAQDVYAAELEYNSQDWLIENPAFRLHVVVRGGSKGNVVYYAPINGVKDREKLKKDIETEIEKKR